MPQETKSHADVGGNEVASLAGFAADLADASTRFDVLEKAFDYRGDVALTLEGGAKVEGYLFDRRRGKEIADSFVRVMAAQGGEKVKVAYTAVRRIEFSTRDPAAGKSFETWEKKNNEKKLAGESAINESAALA